MNKHLSFLRELSKFFTGLIAADMLFGIWTLIHDGAFSFLGTTWTMSAVYSWLSIDALLLIFLIHYAWHTHIPGPKPRKAFLKLAGWVFLLVCVAHFLRVLFGLPLTIGIYPVPFWINAAAVLVTAFLAWSSFAFAKQSVK